eukprot:EG_transcript_25754
MRSGKMTMFDLPDPERIPNSLDQSGNSTVQHSLQRGDRSGSALHRCESANPATWERNPGRLTTRELEMLEAIDPALARTFNNPDMNALYEDPSIASPMTPDASMDPEWARRGRAQAESAPTEVPEDLELALEAIQRQLDILTEAKEKKESKRGKEGDKDPNDPTDLLLAHGLRALLHKVMLLNGPSKYIGVLVKFDQLTFKAKTFEGTNVIATNGTQLIGMLTFWRRHRTQEKLILNNVSGSF